MNTHKNTNKQGEKILLGGVAAAALGLINAKPQTVKAANQNGTRATKKTAKRAVKTKLNYQSETGSETEGETADDGHTGQDSSSQTADSENTAGTSSSAPETGQGQAGTNSGTTSENSADTAAGNTSEPSTTGKAKADKQEAGSAQFDPAKATRDGAITSRWNDILVTADNGILKIGLPDKQYTIKSDSLLKKIGINNNIPWVDTSKITEIDILGTLEIEGYANNLFSGLSSLQTFKGLENLKTDKVTRMDDMFDSCSSLTSLSLPESFNTSKVTNMESMFGNCTALETLDLSYFDTSNVDEMMNMFNGCTNLKSLNLQNFNTDEIDDFNGLKSMFENCTNLEELNIENFNIPSAKSSDLMFDNDPNLRKLVLGPKCDISNSNLNVQGTWVNMGLGKGSPKKGTCKWYYPQAFLDEFNPSTQHDAYVCFADLGGPITVHYQSDNKDIADADEQFGDIDTKLVNGNYLTAFKPKEIKEYKFDHAEFNGSTTDIDSFLFTSKPQTVNLIYKKTTGGSGSGSSSSSSSTSTPGNGSTSSSSSTSTPGNGSTSSSSSTSTPGNGSTSSSASTSTPGNGSTSSSASNSNSSSTSSTPSGSSGISNGSNSSNGSGSNNSSGSNVINNNTPTPIPTNNNKSKKKSTKKAIKGLHANKQSKKALAQSIKGLTANKHQANRPAKLVAAARRLNKTASANNPQKGKQDNALPKTSTEKRSSLAMLALGSLALAAALGAAWLNRKKD